MSGPDTIFALASGSLPAGIAVLRISGTKCSDILAKLVEKELKPRVFSYCNIIDPTNNSVIDKCLVVYFPGPKSFTGEDCLEFHLHGSRAIVKLICSRLVAIENVRFAEAGEFTRRAFENGNLDLSQVEGLGDLLQADTETQRVQALNRSLGGFSDVLVDWRNILIEALVLVEAELDFSDESDVGFFENFVVNDKISSLISSIEDKISGFEYGRIVRDGFRVGIAGLPNVGKSSIINGLAKSNISIVTDEPGTTRDIIECSIEIDGHLVVLFDSAGIRSSSNKVEMIGIERSLSLFDTCDLMLWVSAPDIANSSFVPDSKVPILHVGNKLDIKSTSGTSINISSKAGDYSQLITAILAKIAENSTVKSPVIISHEKDLVALSNASKSLNRAIALLQGSQNSNLELVSEELRSACYALERLLGKVDVDDILDEVFSGFCIGK